MLLARTNPAWFTIELVAHAIVCLLLGALLWWWWRRHPEDRRPLLGTLAAACVWLLASYVVIAPLVPTWAYTAMREGYTQHDLEMAAGSMAQNGVLVDRFLRPTFIPPGRSGTALDVLRIQLGMGGLAVLMFWPIARRITQSARGATVVTALAALNANHVHALLSETEAPTAAPYLVASVLPFSVLLHPGRSKPISGVAWLALAGLTLILGSSRIDLMGAGLAAMATALLWQFPSARALEDRWASTCDRLLAAVRKRPWTLPAACILWLTAGTWIRPFEASRALWQGELYWLRMAIDPFNPTWAALPVFAAAILPAGMVALLVAGMGLALRHPLRHGGLPATVFILWGAYWAAAHGGRLDDRQRISLYELYRYSMLLLPLWWVLIARGWSALAVSFAARPRHVQALALATLLLPPVPEVLHALPYRHPRQPSAREVFPVWGLIQRDEQRQVRELLTFAKHHPECTVITWSERWTGATSRDRGHLLTWRPSQDRKPLETVDTTRDPRPQLSAILEAHDSACIVWLDSLDCHRAPELPNPCDLVRPDTAPLHEARWRTLPFVHPRHGARWMPETHLTFRPFPRDEAADR